MACAQSTFTWSFAPYLSSEDLAEINQQFDAVLKGTQCLVFWTGVHQPHVQQWADERGLKTLTSAMGPLMDVRNPNAARHRMNQTQWTMYMKGASACFATFACQGRQALVLTRPPPKIYSDRVTSTYKLIEEPILKGEFGGPCVTSINYIHFMTEDATDFQYQIWPQDHSTEWRSFLEKLKRKVRNCVDKTSKYIKSSLRLQHQDIQKTILQQKNADEQMPAQAKKEAKKAKKARKAAKKARKEAKSEAQMEMKKEAKNESNRQKVQDKQIQAEVKKQAREQKLREEQMRAQLKKETKEQKLREEKMQAQLKKRAKKPKVKDEQMCAEAEKQSKQQITKDEQMWAEAEKEAKRQIAEQTQARMNKQAKKNAEQQRIQEKQRQTQMRQEAKRQQVLAELMRAQIEKWAKEKQQREERM